MELITKDTMQLARAQMSSELGVENPKNPIELAKELAAKYDGLQKPALDDEEGQKTINEARLECYRKRIAVQRKAKDFEADLKAGAKTIKDFAEQIIEPLQAQETRLKAIQQELKEEKDRREAEAERKRIEAFNARTQTLADLGVFFRGDFYELDGESVTTKRIETATATEWEGITEKFKAVADAKRQREEEAEKVRLENEKLKAELARLKAEASKPEPVEKPVEKPSTDPQPEPVEEVPLPVAEPAKETPKPVAEPAPAVEPAKKTPSPVAPETKPAPSPAKANFMEKYGHIGGANAKHFKGGYIEGVKWAREYLLESLSSVKTRGELKTLIEGLI